jgi:redox-sensitive bicupin YhaK (pirin superfamily)
MKIIRAIDRFKNEHSWLKSYFLLSFDSYYDPENEQFNSLRVFNDDYVDARSGFPPHPHRDMEIITIVLSGAVSHKDSTGGDARIPAGDVQRMSAGEGIVHSEMNNEDEELHLYQLWLIPRKMVNAGYEQKTFSEEFQVVASGQGKGGLYVETDATIYRGKLNGEFRVDAPFLAYITTGSFEVNGEKLEEGDQIRSDTSATIRGSGALAVVSF